MLRLGGVPTRYATGFVVTESSESDENSGEMWIARNKDAHAWVEAYDKQQNEWIVVEATPGVNARRALWLGSDAENSNPLDISQFRSADNRGNWSVHHVIDWIRDRFEMYSTRITLFVNGSFLVGFPVLILFILRKRSRRDRFSYSLRRQSKQIRKLDRRLRRINIVRDRSETLNQFAARLATRDNESEAWIADAAEKYREYATTVYSRI